jgi:environmental stress-induced protein Ves
MSWHITRLADARRSPWRNGGGTTRELARWPDSDDWIWRISVADITADGAFSCFAGVERWFTVLSGAGVRLSISERTHEADVLSDPLCFDGATPVNCQMRNGATQDLNLMVRRERASGHMTRVSGEQCFVQGKPSTVAVYATQAGAAVSLDGAVTAIPGDSLAWRSVPADTVLRLSAERAYWMAIELCE